MRHPKIISAVALVAAAFSLTGCGKESFKVTSAVAAQKAPGHFVIPPKVDILLAEDDTGSMFEAYGPIAAQMPVLLDSLEAKGWDYHFATTPLVNRARALDQVLASKHDPNWGSLFTPPFPGATATTVTGKVAPFAFRKPNQYTHFINVNSDVSNGWDGREEGLESIRTALTSRAANVSGQGNPGFIRNDALLVVLVVGNGEDTSGVTMCDRRDRIIGNGNDEFIGPCEDVGFPAYGTKASSFNSYKNALNAVKPNPGQLKVFAAVSSTWRNNCLGGSAYRGDRYINMAAEFGGQSYDICTQPIAAALEGMAENLQATKLAMVTRYLIIDQDAEESTIEVTKYVNGDLSQAQSVPHSATDGWTYAGQTSGYAIESPIPLNQFTGFAVELHGSYKLHGDDTGTVTFKPKGAKDAASN